MNKKNRLYTVGHSTHPIDDFVKLLEPHNIKSVCDVRSSPYSAHNPQYNRETLKKSLEEHGHKYIYLGGKLGPRSDDPDFYIDNKVSYERLAAADTFKKGLAEIYELSASGNLALMCSEKDPVMCHRMILICRHIRNDFDIFHILEDGSLENNADSEKRLLMLLKMQEQNLFDSYEDIVDNAYDIQAGKIAYRMKDDE